MGEKAQPLRFDVLHEDSRMAFHRMLSVWEAYFDGLVGEVELRGHETHIQETYGLSDYEIGAMSFTAFSDVYELRHLPEI